MTVQLAIANCTAIALASDRHIYRDGPGRSTGQEVKLTRLRGKVPAAMMAAGPLAVLNTPVSRLGLRIEAALRTASREGTPEALGQAVLGALDAPLAGGEAPAQRAEADARLLAEIADEMVQRAHAHGGDARAALQAVLADLEAAPRCTNEASVRAFSRATWTECASELPALVSGPTVAAALSEAPELIGQVVVAALSRGSSDAGTLYITVGLCCPATGVPVLATLRLWRGVGGRLLSASRLGADFEAVWKASRTVVVAQGSGRSVIEAMIDGVAEEHWVGLPSPSRAKLGSAMSGRWDKVHDRIAVSSTRELGAIATGLVRGAEVLGYLTREGEGTIASVDCLLVTPQGVLAHGLPAEAAAPSPSLARRRSQRGPARNQAVA